MMYKHFNLKATVCVTTAFQPKGTTVSFKMSGDQGLVSDVRVYSAEAILT